MRNLYELTTDMQRIDALLDEVEGDLSLAAEKMPQVEAFLASLAEDQAVKLDGYVMYLRKLESEAAAAKAEEEQWAAKRKARERRAEYLKGRLKDHLEKTGQQKVETAAGRLISLARNGGNPPVEYALVVPPLDAPGEYVKVSRQWNYEAVVAALKDGELPFAKFGERGVSLRIR